MAEDILSEISQDIKQEKYEKFLLNNWKKFLYISIFIVSLTAISLIINNVQNQTSKEVGSLYYNAYQNQKTDFYKKVIIEKHNGFTPLAALNYAAVKNSEGDHQQAIEIVTDLQSNSKNYDKALIDKAKLDKAFYLIKNKGKEAEILLLLNEVIAASTFSSTAKEVKALYLLQNGNNVEAEKLLQELANSASVQPTIKERANKILKTYKK